MRTRADQTIPARVRAEDQLLQVATLLVDEPRTVQELVDLTGFPVRSIRARLFTLEAMKCAHRERFDTDAGIGYRWCAGAAQPVAPIPTKPATNWASALFGAAGERP